MRGLDTAAVRQQAKDAEIRSDWAAAAARYEELVRADATEFWDRYFHVRALIYSGQVKLAERHLNALRDAGWDQVADVELLAASFSEHAGRPDTAAKWMCARELGANPYWTLYGEARERVRRGEIRRARELADRFVRCPEAESSGLRFAACMYFRDGDPQAAEEILKAIAASPSDRVEIVLDSLPGMTWNSERMALYRAAQQTRVPGHFVDLGTFLGSLTVPMLCGLQANEDAKRNGTRLYAYDHFLWHPTIGGQWWDILPGNKPRDKESFRQAYEFVVERWSAYLGLTQQDLNERLTIVEADLAFHRWEHGDISLLSIDAMKIPEVANAIITQFMTRLAPGGLCFHQDFGMKNNWWIPIHQYLLRDHFEIVDPLPGAHGLLFRLVKPISDADAQRVCAHELSDAKTAEKAFAYWTDRVHQQDQATIAAAAAFYRSEYDFPEASQSSGRSRPLAVLRRVGQNVRGLWKRVRIAGGK
jgi:hypothetical protein